MSTGDNKIFMITNNCEMAESGEQQLEESNGYSKYGITDVLPKTSVTTAWGQTKTCAGLSLKELIFIVVSVLNILAAIGITLVRFIQVIEDDATSPDFTFALLLLVNAGFCLFYVGHGVLREKVYELYVFIVAIIVILVYCIVEYAVNENGRNTLKLVRLILACVLAPPNIILAAIVARQFGYLQFRIVGASEYLQHLYKQASIFSCLLKFDVQVTVSIVILVLKEGTTLTLTEQLTLAIGIPYSLLWNILGWFVLRRELKVGAWVFAFLGFAKPAYYIYKIVKQYQSLHDDTVKTSTTITYSLFASVALGLLLWIILMAELVVVYNNFGQGLKERAFDRMSEENTSLITGRRRRWKLFS